MIFPAFPCMEINAGELEFRSAISKFLYNRRNIDCSVSDIFLGAGIQYLLTVAVMILGTDKVYGFEKSN